MINSTMFIALNSQASLTFFYEIAFEIAPRAAILDEDTQIELKMSFSIVFALASQCSRSNYYLRCDYNVWNKC